VSYAFLTSLALLLGSIDPGLTTSNPQSSPVFTDPLTHYVQALDDTLDVRWVLKAETSEARYRVREQLAGFDFPNDAVGVTRQLEGQVVLDPQGAVISEESEFRIQLSSLTSDNERRDGYVRRRTLEVESYPEAILVPREFVGLDPPLPESGPVTFELVADLTLHGKTASTLWKLTAEFGADTITGIATTAFTFDIFGIPVPQVARVLSVDDNIRLELEFTVVRDGG
jgi:polyisoprenoid-binding protein YceI